MTSEAERQIIADLAAMPDEAIRVAALTWDRDALWLIMRAIARRIHDLPRDSFLHP